MLQKKSTDDKDIHSKQVKEKNPTNQFKETIK